MRKRKSLRISTSATLLLLVWFLLELFLACSQKTTINKFSLKSLKYVHMNNPPTVLNKWTTIITAAKALGEDKTTSSSSESTSIGTTSGAAWTCGTAGTWLDVPTSSQWSESGTLRSTSNPIFLRWEQRTAAFGGTPFGTLALMLQKIRVTHIMLQLNDPQNMRNSDQSIQFFICLLSSRMTEVRQITMINQQL